MAGSKYKIEIGIAGVEKTVAGINKVRSASQARAAAAEARRRLAQIDLEERRAAEEALPPKQRLARLEQERERNKKRLADAERKLQERERRGLKSPAMDHRVQALRLANKEIDRHIAKIQRANTEAKKGGLGSAIGGRLRGMVAAGAGFFGLRAGRQTLSDVGELARNAGTIGVGTDFLQELQFGGRENSINERTTAMGIQRFGRRLQEAQAGKGELKGTLAELGIDPVGLSIEEAMKKFADAIAALPEDQRLRHAFKAFDSEGAALVNVLANGSKGLEEMAKRAHEAGGVIERDVVLRLAEADMKLEVFGKRVKVGFANALDSLATSIEFVRPAWQKFIDAVMTGATFFLRLGEEILQGNLLGAMDAAIHERDAFAKERIALREKEAEQEKKLLENVKQRKAAPLLNQPNEEKSAVAKIQNNFAKQVDQLQQIGGFRGGSSGHTNQLRELNREVKQMRHDLVQALRRNEDATREALG